MANDLIRYDLRVQDAMRGVIRKVLADAARDGLPGEHHFQVTFHTDAPGVRLSTEMRRRFPVEMTIILQYQFRELSVSDTAVEVVLFFNHVPERLVIPFDAITGFFDPSVEFGLRFDVRSDPLPELSAPVPGPKLVAVAPSDAGSTRPAPRSAGSDPVEVLPMRGKPGSGKAAEAPGRALGKPGEGKPAKAAEPASGDKPPVPAKSGESKIISIDSFRRKP